MRYLTNAPDAYDYGYTATVEKETWYEAYPGARKTLCRRVDIPEEHVAYQTARYLSGLYIAVEAL